jgi:hypothetical protein
VSGGDFRGKEEATRRHKFGDKKVARSHVILFP